MPRNHNVYVSLYHRLTTIKKIAYAAMSTIFYRFHHRFKEYVYW